jgi:hypothetical protein
VPKYEWFGVWNTRTRYITLNNVMYQMEYNLDTNELSLYHWEFFSDEHETEDHVPLVTISLTELPLVNDAIRMLATAFAEQMIKLAEENEDA